MTTSVLFVGDGERRSRHRSRRQPPVLDGKLNQSIEGYNGLDVQRAKRLLALFGATADLHEPQVIASSTLLDELFWMALMQKSLNCS